MAECKPILWRIDRDSIRFIDYYGDEKDLISSLKHAFNSDVARSQKLIYVQRIEIPLYGWIIPLFIDDEGFAWLEVIENAPALEAVVESLSSSPLFGRVS